MPVIRLNTVVLPAPFGPITLIISCGLTSRSRSCTAARPPKCLVTLFNFSRAPLAISSPMTNSFLNTTQHAPPIQSQATQALQPKNLLPLPLLPPHATHAVCAHWVSALL